MRTPTQNWLLLITWCTAQLTNSPYCYFMIQSLVRHFKSRRLNNHGPCTVEIFVSHLQTTQGHQNHQNWGQFWIKDPWRLGLLIRRASLYLTGTAFIGGGNLCKPIFHRASLIAKLEYLCPHSQYKSLPQYPSTWTFAWSSHSEKISNQISQEKDQIDTINGTTRSAPTLCRSLASLHLGDPKVFDALGIPNIFLFKFAALYCMSPWRFVQPDGQAYKKGVKFSTNHTFHNK